MKTDKEIEELIGAVARALCLEAEPENRHDFILYLDKNNLNSDWSFDQCLVDHSDIVILAAYAKAALIRNDPCRYQWVHYDDGTPSWGTSRGLRFTDYQTGAYADCEYDPSDPISEATAILKICAEHLNA